jgi:hypothetical protein
MPVARSKTMKKPSAASMVLLPLTSTGRKRSAVPDRALDPLMSADTFVPPAVANDVVVVPTCAKLSPPADASVDSDASDAVVGHMMRCADVPAIVPTTLSVS